MKTLGMCVHFGDFETFVWTFEEVFAQAPYAVQLPPRPLILDCGANIGLSVLYFKQRFPDAQIVAFEPEESNHRLLVANVAANQLLDVSCHRAALGSEAGSMTLYKEPGKAGSVLGTLERPRLAGATETQTVDVQHLSSHVHGPVDLIKLDVEGSEGLVLTDLNETGKLSLVSRMLIEYHLQPGSDHLSLAQTLTLLEVAGFTVQIATPEHRTPVNAESGNVLIYAYHADRITRSG